MDLHLEGLSTLELAALVDQGLHSLNARLESPEGVRDEFEAIAGEDVEPLARSIPGFREP
jgi:hypothetical protein